jgi:hypothetical protein
MVALIMLLFPSVITCVSVPFHVLEDTIQTRQPGFKMQSRLI